MESALPYDAPNQAAWQQDGVNGYAAHAVANTVKIHDAWGLGSYIFTNTDPTLHATQSFEVPNTPGVVMHDLTTVALNSNAGTIDHVIDGQGPAATSVNTGHGQTVTTYTNGTANYPRHPTTKSVARGGYPGPQVSRLPTDPHQNERVCLVAGVSGIYEAETLQRALRGRQVISCPDRNGFRLRAADPVEKCSLGPLEKVRNTAL